MSKVGWEKKCTGGRRTCMLAGAVLCKAKNGRADPRIETRKKGKQEFKNVKKAKNCCQNV